MQNNNNRSESDPLLELDALVDSEVSRREVTRNQNRIDFPEIAGLVDDIHKRLVKEGATLDMARKSVKVVFAHNLCTGKQLGVPPEGFNIPVVE